MDFLPTKGVEYLLVLGYLALLVPFWWFFFGQASSRVPASARVARRLAPSPAEMFRVPDGVMFHAGHAWARPEEAGVMTVGLDDFAQQLMGPVAAIDLPHPGAAIWAGAPAWALRADGRSVDMLAPVTGTVVAVNGDLARQAGLVNEDPYGRGWLLKVQVPKVAGLGHLFSGAAARKWIAAVSDELTATMSPQLGTVLQDGGVPVHGIARSLDEAHWDDVARKFLRS